MPTEAELRPHRCCFTGHRPEKLGMSEDDVIARLIVSDEFVDLSVEDEPQNAKTARSTAGKER